MARVCTLLNVPRPERGYWAKLAAGKAPDPPPLPEARAGDHLVWARDGAPAVVQRDLPKRPANPPQRRVKRTGPRPTEHQWIVGAKPLFEAGRLSYNVGYLKSAKRLLVDLVVTKTTLDKALAFANQLFFALEDRGHRVVIGPSTESFHRADVDERESPCRQAHYNNPWYPGR